MLVLTILQNWVLVNINFVLIFSVHEPYFAIRMKIPKLQSTFSSTIKILLIVRQTLQQNMKEIDSNLLSLNEDFLTQP